MEDVLLVKEPDSRSQVLQTHPECAACLSVARREPGNLRTSGQRSCEGLVSGRPESHDEAVGISIDPGVA